MWTLYLLGLLPLVIRADPTPCCIAHQFQATLYEVGGYLDINTGVPSPTDFSANIFYDFDAQLLRSDRSQFNDDGTVTITKVIQDYKHHKQYIIIGPKCIAQPLTTQMTPPCVPPNSTYLGRQQFGSSIQNVMGDTYRIHLPSLNTTMKMSVDVADCTPLFSSSYGTAGGGSWGMNLGEKQTNHLNREAVLE